MLLYTVIPMWVAAKIDDQQLDKGPTLGAEASTLQFLSPYIKIVQSLSEE